MMMWTADGGLASYLDVRPWAIHILPWPIHPLLQRCHVCCNVHNRAHTSIPAPPAFVQRSARPLDAIHEVLIPSSVVLDHQVPFSLQRSELASNWLLELC